MTYSEELKAMWRADYDALAIYNAEVSRGIQHHDDYKARMATIQNAYNEDLQRIARKHCMAVIKC